MMKHNIPIQSLIDHIKTAIDVDPWAKEMAEELLKEQEAVEPKQVEIYGRYECWGLVCGCTDCDAVWMSRKENTHFCPNCGRPVKWE